MFHKELFCISVLRFPYNWYFMSHKSCFVYLCSAFPIIGILCLTSVVLYICVMISLLLYFMFHKRCFVYLWWFPYNCILCFTRLFCISVFCFPYNWYFMYHKRCFVYLCYDFPIIGILRLVVLYICVWFPYNLYFMYHKRCFVYLCSAFPIIGILCFTSVVLYICVLLSLLWVFYISQALFCISLFCFPYYWYFMFHKRCFVYLCYDFPIICILCLTRVVLYICVLLSLLLVFYVSQALFCISVLWFPYNWYFMFHKVVLYICVLLSLLLYVSQALFCISLLWFPYYWYFMFHKSCFVYLCYDFPIIGILCITSVVLYICVMISLLLVFYVSQALFCISVLWFPYNLYFMFHKSCFVYLCSAFPIIGILCLTSVVLYICVMISLLLVFYVHKRCFVYLCYDFPIIGILCFTSVVLYICVMISP